MRHAANGHIEYVDPESVPYLGYLPQDLADKEALQLYHPDDLHYLHQVYDTIVKEGGLSRSKPYRLVLKKYFIIMHEISALWECRRSRFTRRPSSA